MSAMVTLFNPFHKTDVMVRPRNGRLSAAQAAYVRKALCGISGCACAGSAASGDLHRLAQAVPDRDGSVRLSDVLIEDEEVKGWVCAGSTAVRRSESSPPSC